MALKKVSTKHLAIDKANAQTVGSVAAAAFIAIFCLFAAKSVVSQIQYQSKLTREKQKAHVQLQKNVTAFQSLTTAYRAFDSTATNVIGGTTKGTGDNDGNNSKIILDALPSKYD